MRPIDSVSSPGTPILTHTSLPNASPPHSARIRSSKSSPINSLELNTFLKTLTIPKTPEATLSQFYLIAMQLSHETQKPLRPELKYMTAKLFEVLDLKNPTTFEYFQIDGNSQKWPTSKKAYKLCKYLHKFGVIDFIDHTAKNRVNLSIQAITFIHNFKKEKLVPAAHLAVLKCASEANFQQFITETLALTTNWKEQDLKDLIEAYLMENEISTANQSFYLELARTFNLSRLSTAFSPKPSI
jgi:hypothetical protein